MNYLYLKNKDSFLFKNKYLNITILSKCSMGNTYFNTIKKQNIIYKKI